MTDGTGSNENVIGAGDTFAFTLDIVGTASSYSEGDFIELSAQVDGHTISYAAAKFYDGGDRSAFGATNLPEPSTIFLFGSGGLALLRRRRQGIKCC